MCLHDFAEPPWHCRSEACEGSAHDFNVNFRIRTYPPPVAPPLPPQNPRSRRAHPSTAGVIFSRFTCVTRVAQRRRARQPLAAAGTQHTCARVRLSCRDGFFRRRLRRSDLGDGGGGSIDALAPFALPAPYMLPRTAWHGWDRVVRAPPLIHGARPPPSRTDSAPASRPLPPSRRMLSARSRRPSSFPAQVHERASSVSDDGCEARARRKFGGVEH